MKVTHLAIEQILAFQADSIRRHGGSGGIRDMGLIESALAQPKVTFGGEELYPDLVGKAAALAYSFAKNHGFIDGNKRIALASLDMFLRVNDHKLDASIEVVVNTILAVASSEMDRETFTTWVRDNTVPLNTEH